MASNFKIGTTSGGVTSLDALTVACPDPQWEFHEYQVMITLGDGSLKGMGPRTAIWNFPLIEDAQIAQLETFQASDPIYIRTRKRDGSYAIFETHMNWVDPRQDGEHVEGLQGYRSGLTIQFVVLSEVA